ncbi:alkylated DNA repair protein alkB homolog 8 [Ricinus communis]|uniref:alkylated DNA repair protein alkB homolog 8 n=1 Tax=Ricinus communis TaxID=3988 RepID=UPI00201AECBD|nr:alkylated DNA repair protein alkB homolog 8 [Ricinus communis]XP_015582510.2 alkylated DNA repair protein alkB homolog 8 [Ricinus communis]
MEDEKTILKEVFGESSESEAEESIVFSSLHDDGSHSTTDQNPTWELIHQINGLWLCRNFLSSHQQSTLLSHIQNEGWFTESSNNQAMRFGDLPSWAIQLSHSIREVVLFGDQISQSPNLGSCDEENGSTLLPSNLLWREPLFDQLIVNVYQPGEGICAHVDLMRFEDGIAIVSLESSCVMHFTQVRAVDANEKGEKDQDMTSIPVYLTPGSLVLLWGDARYLWKHEINRKPGFQMWEGQELSQKRRTSITLRMLCPSV